MSAREEILDRIRIRLGRAGEPERPDEINRPPLRPVVGDDLVAHFTAMADAVAATVEEVDGPEAVPGAIAGYLQSKGLDPEITAGDDPWLAAMRWAAAGIEAVVRPPREAGLVGVSHAAFAMAETGTVALASGPHNPVTLNYLADYHIVVVERSRVVAYQEEIWAEYRKDRMPRALCFITGPSRTGDIEFDIQLGAHGPRNLHVIVVASD